MDETKMIVEGLQTPVKEVCDVLVCGGGVAGVAAALAAARQNKKVILCEREFILGGLATAGLVAIYLPLCDGMGRQVSFGIAEELLKLSVAQKAIRGAGYVEWIENPKKAKDKNSPRYEVEFNPNLFALSLEKLLMETGVKILYGTVAVQAYEKDGLIESVVFENKSGRFAILPKGVVDATGDCDVAKHLPLPCALYSNKNPVASWYYFYANNRVGLRPFGGCDITDEEMKKNGQPAALAEQRFSGVDGEELSVMTQLSHRALWRDYLKNKEKAADFDLVTMATIPQVRMTRRIVGEYELDESDAHKPFEDSMGMISDWRKRGPVFEVPLRCLYNRKVKNLAVAGRCMSATDKAWDITRVIPCCAVTGEAAGTAVALFPDLTKADINSLQETLRKNGVPLHKNQL